MPEAHVRLYEAFGQDRGFPTRRIELYLAQLAMIMAKTMGGAKDVTVKDFLIDPPTHVTVEDDIDALKVAIGFKPRNA